MPDQPYLLRDDVPLTEAQWEAIDAAVAVAASRSLVARRFIPMAGPLGAGVQAVLADRFEGAEVGSVGTLGEGDDLVSVSARRTLALPLVYKDFVLHWRDIEASRESAALLDTGPAAAAAVACAQAEDNLVFHGHDDLGIEGLLTVEGATQLSLAGWEEPGQAVDDVAAAAAALTDQGFFGPFALALHPRRYAMLTRVYTGTGVLEIDQVRELASAGVYRTPVLPEGAAVVLAVGPQNVDLVLGQDIVTAFRETTALNHVFRVFETVAVRVKRPGAVCLLQG